MRGALPTGTVAFTDRSTRSTSDTSFDISLVTYAQRLFEVAAATRREEALQTALQGIQIGAVGPVVAEELRRRGVEVTVTPDHGYFMKPLVSAFLAAFSR